MEIPTPTKLEAMYAWLLKMPFNVPAPVKEVHSSCICLLIDENLPGTEDFVLNTDYTSVTRRKQLISIKKNLP